MKHDNDNAGRNRSSNAQIAKRLREFWRNFVNEAAATILQNGQPQPMRVIARARDRNRSPKRY
ncbi:hypothetical protein FHX15_005579 [Rhizobium sp. BK650]|uniref:hypothetical protein n=1 Tax=Rhizobium sp. BK650 TaxID=2586990 RepID=UPI001610EB1B|nr:hypothetical protein [Rhizobium sp. BK650]MBB3660310.1 hypothetical protein [Rhizobium sp. BK650]